MDTNLVALILLVSIGAAAVYALMRKNKKKKEQRQDEPAAAPAPLAPVATKAPEPAPAAAPPAPPAPPAEKPRRISPVPILQPTPGSEPRSDKPAGWTPPVTFQAWGRGGHFANFDALWAEDKLLAGFYCLYASRWYAANHQAIIHEHFGGDVVKWGDWVQRWETLERHRFEGPVRERIIAMFLAA